jgi:hypothetical protein
VIFPPTEKAFPAPSTLHETPRRLGSVALPAASDLIYRNVKPGDRVDAPLGSRRLT